MLNGLRIRTTLLVTLLVAAVGFGYGALALTRERATLHERLRAEIEATLDALAIPCAAAIANDRVDTLDSLVANLAGRGQGLGLLEVTVVDHTGRVLADSRIERFGELLTDGFTRQALQSPRPLWRLDGGRALAAYPVISGLRWGTLRAAVTLEPLERALAVRRLELIGFFALATVSVAALLMVLLGLLVVGPIQRLAGVVRRIAGGDRSARVSRYRGDEIGELGRVFDEMAATIDRHTDELERTVAERTSQLADANLKLSQTNRRLTAANVQLEQLAVTDGLTGMFNHRYFQEMLSREVKRAERADHQFALLMIDVDHFKHYNDSFGHPAGDILLRELGRLFGENLRQNDVVARYGGEEFIALLVDSDRRAGTATAEKLRGLIAAHPFANREQQPLGAVTISVGIAFYPADGRTPGDLIYAADQALYRSKHAGRNCVTATEVPA
ncbi:MAG: diguanylate cyclase [Deltaproteobacteria bacterium]|nr:diguanylate cyclase [Deltaproteobacteria bacterium]